MKHLVKGRETARAEIGIEEFPSWGSVGEIKERQLGSSVKSRLKSRNASFTLDRFVRLFPSFRRLSWRISPSLWRRARSDAGVSQYSYICRPINEIRIALIIRDAFSSPAGGFHFGSRGYSGYRGKGWKRHLASVPPLSLVNFTSLG